jgi:hypothetical protein
MRLTYKAQYPWYVTLNDVLVTGSSTIHCSTVQQDCTYLHRNQIQSSKRYEFLLAYQSPY